LYYCTSQTAVFVLLYQSDSSICTFVPVRQQYLYFCTCQTARQRLASERQPRARLRHTLSHRPVSICTFVPVKRVKCVRAPATCSPQAHSEPQACQYLYFCTSTARKVGASKASKVGGTPQEPACQYLYICTSKASKVGAHLRNRPVHIATHAGRFSWQHRGLVIHVS
jgi:hypothetical protein